jgi:hypothetical protein
LTGNIGNAGAAWHGQACLSTSGHGAVVLRSATPAWLGGAAPVVACCGSSMQGRRGNARRGLARPDPARQSMAGAAWRSLTWHFAAQLVFAEPCTAMPAMRGLALHGSSRLVLAWPGPARHGPAAHGKAGNALHGSSRQGPSGQGVFWPGNAGWARREGHRAAWPCRALQGRRCAATRVNARRGAAGFGRSRQGNAGAAWLGGAA